MLIKLLLMNCKQYSAPYADVLEMMLESNIMSNQNESPVVDESFPGEPDEE